MPKRFLLTTTYVLFALGLDLIFDITKTFSMFENGFDTRKFLLWLVFPLTYFIAMKPKGEIQASFAQIKKKDWLIICSISILAVGAMFIIPYIDVLSQYYVDRSHVSNDHKIAFLKFNLFWIFSWALGWEFLIRFLWMNSFETSKRKFCYGLIPLIEILYHYNKPWPEIIGVGALSLVLVHWTIKRKNMLPAMIAHIIIELILVIYLLI
jgi:membrane protease YdiL (CAAX protease family)